MRAKFAKSVLGQATITDAAVFSAVEMGQTWLESLTYQMVNVRPAI